MTDTLHTLPARQIHRIASLPFSILGWFVGQKRRITMFGTSPVAKPWMHPVINIWRDSILWRVAYLAALAFLSRSRLCLCIWVGILILVTWCRYYMLNRLPKVNIETECEFTIDPNEKDGGHTKWGHTAVKVQLVDTVSSLQPAVRIGGFAKIAPSCSR